MTIKEMHIALDNQLLLLSSNRKLRLLPQDKDYLLNLAQYDFIERRSSKKLNSKQEGFEDTVKRLTDLRELKRSTSLVAYIDTFDNRRVFCVLPNDCYKIIPSGSCDLEYSCNGSFKTTTNGTKSIQYVSIPFNDDASGSAGEYYQGMIISITNTVPTTTTIFTHSGYMVRSTVGKFMVINEAISYINNLNVCSIYWETYGNIYIPNNFIIIPTDQTETYTIATITYNTSVTNTASFATPLSYNYNNGSSATTIKKPNDLVSTEDIESLLNNYYFTKNRYLKPIRTVDWNFIRVYQDTTFKVVTIYLDYIKYPRILSLDANVNCELGIQAQNEIVSIAAQIAKTYIKDNTLPVTVQENNIDN
jgi:hypothetical protein